MGDDILDCVERVVHFLDILRALLLRRDLELARCARLGSTRLGSARHTERSRRSSHQQQRRQEEARA